MNLRKTGALSILISISFVFLMGATTSWMRKLSIGDSSLDASSLFDIISTTKGSRSCPSMSTAQKNAVSSPATGLCVYDSTLNQLSVYDGTAWEAVNQTLQNVYENSPNPELTVDSINGALTVQDNGTPIAANLLEITSNGGGTTYFKVDATVTEALSLNVDNLNLNGNTIISTDTNGSVIITPNGTGELELSSPLLLNYETTPANPAASKVKVYSKNDNKLYLLDSTGGETEIGAGAGSGTGAVNYIGNHDFEDTLTIWASFDDGAIDTPVDGTGGSPSTITCTRNTTTPLRETGDLKIAKTAADGQGEGCSYAFSIELTDQHSVLSISFDAKTTTNYADNDIGVYIYDVTNAVIIEPGPKDILAGEFGKSVYQFQTASNSTSYRLIFHVQSTNATAYDVHIDNLIVGPSVRNFGTPNTYLGAYTPSGTDQWTGNATFTAQHWRQGSFLVVNFKVTGAAAPTGGVDSGTIYLPSGLNIDFNKLENYNTNGAFVGSLSGTFSGVGNFTGDMRINLNTTSDRLKLWFNNPAASTSTSSNPLNRTSMPAVAYDVTGEFKIPIQGWEETVQMSDDADSRVVAAVYNTNTAQVISGATTYLYEDLIKDTHSAYATGTGIYTVPVSGFYDIKASSLIQSVAWTAGENIHMSVLVNGSTTFSISRYEMETTHTDTVFIGGSAVLSLVKGDTFVIQITENRAAGTVTTHATPSWNNLSIHRIIGPSAIAANELVAFGARTSAGQSVASNPDVVYGTEDWDTHGAYDASTGIFTAPIAGKYHFSANFLFVSTLTTAQTLIIQLLKNGTIEAQSGISGTNNASQQLGPNINFDLDLVKDDTVKIKVNSPVAGTLSTTALNNVFTGHRLGF